jgi:hypothetical protein
MRMNGTSEPPTWAEFKAMMQRAGVKDGDRIYLVDFDYMNTELQIDRDKVGVEVTGV